MFPKEIRLHLRLERDFFKRSKRGVFSAGSIYYEASEKNLFAITVSKNYSPLATLRNSLKRYIKEKVVSFSSEISTKETYKIVFLINRKTKKTKEEIWKSMYEVLTKLYKK